MPGFPIKRGAASTVVVLLIVEKQDMTTWRSGRADRELIGKPQGTDDIMIPGPGMWGSKHITDTRTPLHVLWSGSKEFQ